MLTFEFCLRPCWNITERIRSPSFVAAIKTIIWTGCFFFFHQYQYILWGKWKPAVFLWVHQLILKEIFSSEKYQHRMGWKRNLILFKSFASLFYLSSFRNFDKKIVPSYIVWEIPNVFMHCLLDKTLRYSHFTWLWTWLMKSYCCLSWPGSQQQIWDIFLLERWASISCRNF